MKKIIFWLLIILLLFLGVFAFFQNKEKAVIIDVEQEVNTEEEDLEETNVNLEDLIKNSEIIIPGTNQRVKLNNGNASIDQGSDTYSVSLISIIQTFDFENKKHFFADLAVNAGGTGTFRYVIFYSYENNNLNYSGFEFIGDRLPILNINKLKENQNGYFVRVAYLDRDRDAAMASEPNIRKEKILRVEGNSLVPSQELIYVTNINSGSVISSPVIIRGFVNKTWYSGSTFPIYIVDWNGLIIGESTAVLEGNPNSDGFISFRSEIEFEFPAVYDYGTFILQRSNSVSGSENNALEIQIKF